MFRKGLPFRQYNPEHKAEFFVSENEQDQKLKTHCPNGHFCTATAIKSLIHM